MKAELSDVLRLMKAAKESELEAIEQLMKMYSSGEDAGEKKTEESKISGSEDYESMSAAELYKLCCQKGLSGKCKDRKRATLIALLSGEEKPEKEDTKAGKGRKPKKGDAKQEKKEAGDPGDDWGEEEEKGYDGMTAQELYKECVSRGIECEKRKKSANYIKLLKEDDAKNEDSGDDWGDDPAGGDDSGDDWEL